MVEAKREEEIQSESQKADSLTVLQESVIQSLEGGVKGTKVSTFHAYVDGRGDFEAEKISQLKEDVLQISKVFVGGMPLTENKVEVMVPVHETDYSPLFGVPVEKDAREVIGFFLNGLIDQCNLAILADCGFGKFSASPEKIKEAQEQLRDNIETISLPFSSGERELKIMAYDSNNNLKEGRVADGLCVPFRAIGLVKSEEFILGFMAIMDYRSGEWGIDRLDTEFLYELAEDSSLFNEAYRKIVGNEFNEAEISAANSELINFLEVSPYFKQALNRVCARWTTY